MTKSDILQAAFRTWGRTLYQTTSLTQLAQDLGVTKSALYRHFKNKQALLDGMYEWFFDDYGNFIRADFYRAINAADPGEGIFIFMRIVIEYYLRNMDAFIFALINVYGDRKKGNPAEYLLARGLDMQKLRRLEEHLSGAGGEERYPSIIQLIIVTLTFWVAYFHRSRHAPRPAVLDGPLKQAPAEGLCSPESTPPEALPESTIQGIIASLEEKIAGGLGFKRELVAAVDYEKLEKLAAETAFEFPEQDELLRAVAEAVAETGPWNTSMDMVARRSGLSKSGLYAHFKNKQDMLRQFFLTEFELMVKHAEACISKSTAPAERFYLGIIAIADYLRCRPEILMAMDWLRIRRLELGLMVPPRIYSIFTGIMVPRTEGAGEPVSDQTAQWILFLIVNTLMRRPEGMDFSAVTNAGFRILYRFVGLGLKGFNR